MRDFNIFTLGIATGMLIDLIVDVLTFIRKIKHETMKLKIENEKAGN